MCMCEREYCHKYVDLSILLYERVCIYTYISQTNKYTQVYFLIKKFHKIIDIATKYEIIFSIFISMIIYLVLFLTFDRHIQND